MKFHWLKRLFFIKRDQKGEGVTKNRFYVRNFFAKILIENISAKKVLISKIFLILLTRCNFDV
jgi:hypothetical protein